MSRIGSPNIQSRREWIQERITCIERQLRRRIKGKLICAGWYDEEDILASMRRRLDVKVFKGELPVNNEAQLNRLISKMAERVAIDKYRQARRQHHLERIVAQSALEITQAHPSESDRPPLEIIIPALRQEDQALVKLWTNGLSQKDIAAELGISLEAYRTRRKRLIARLRGQLAIAQNIARKVEAEMTFGGPGEIKVTVLREVRAEATAR